LIPSQHQVGCYAALTASQELTNQLRKDTDQNLGLHVKGMQCYGIGAELPTEDMVTHAMHSDNERIKERPPPVRPL